MPRRDGAAGAGGARRRAALVSLACAAVALGCRPASDAAPTHSQRVDALVAKYFDAEGPGIAIAVIQRGELRHAKGYGLADVARRLPVLPTTVFDLASLAKQITGMAVLLLEARGRLSLRDDVRKYLPELPAFD